MGNSGVGALFCDNGKAHGIRRNGDGTDHVNLNDIAWTPDHKSLLLSFTGGTSKPARIDVYTPAAGAERTLTTADPPPWGITVTPDGALWAVDQQNRALTSSICNRVVSKGYQLGSSVLPGPTYDPITKLFNTTKPTAAPSSRTAWRPVLWPRLSGA